MVKKFGDDSKMGVKKLLTINLALTAAVLVLVLISLGGKISVSIGTPRDPVKPVLEKIAKHEEFQGFEDQIPRISYLDKKVLDLFKLNNVTFFENASEGDLMLEYTGMTAIYSPKEDKVVGLLKARTLPKDFLQKLLAHPELSGHENIMPRITLINEAFLDQMRQNNATFFAPARSGDYLVQYNDLVLVYNYEQDRIVNSLRLSAAPQDLLQKALKHPELSGYSTQMPTITQLDQKLLELARQQNPNIYNDAKVGMFVLRYPDKLVVYDYANDKIVKDVNIRQNTQQ